MLIELEGHGCEELFPEMDLTRTVEEQLCAVPNHRIGYGLSRCLRDDDEELREMPRAEVSFNDLEQALPVAAPLHAARESSRGESVAEEVLDCVATVDPDAQDED